MITSVGIIPYRKNSEGEYEFFLGHPGGHYWEGKDYWSFLKGEMAKGEDEKDTAVREFGEESGIALTEEEIDRMWYLGKIRQNQRKYAIAYALEKEDIDPARCFSNLVDDADFPEIDMYQWIPFSSLEGKTHEKYMTFYNKIKEQKH